jgi:hypothetical protein
MWVYWTLFCAPAMASLSPWRLARSSRLMMFVATAIALTAIIGLRDHVGADWVGYGDILAEDAKLTVGQLILGREPGFALITWLSLQFGWGQVGMNAFSAIIFVAGLSIFLFRQPSPWGGLALATPVLVIQLGMSGIRQACALGFFCMAMNAFTDRRVGRYLIFTLLAFTFHQTAILLAPLAIFIPGALVWSNRAVRVLATGVIVMLVLVFGFRDFAFYGATYVQQDLGGAAGALPRVAFNVVGAVLFFLTRRRWQATYPDSRLFLVLAALTILLTPLTPFLQVAVDRVEYYLIPFQVAVMMRVPEFLAPRIRLAYLGIVFSVYAAALAVWLNYSWIAQLTWEPYRSVVF